MPLVKISRDEARRRKQRATDWKQFRQDNMFTQKRLAEIIGISRRTVQQIEGGHIAPHMQTLRRFAVLRSKFSTQTDLVAELRAEA